MQFEIEYQLIYLPPIGTAGLDLVSVNGIIWILTSS
jgi:hypothetical protein